jgi:hypothetical protein
VRRLLMVVDAGAATAAIATIVVYGRMHASLLVRTTATPIQVARRTPAPALVGTTLAGSAVSLRSLLALDRWGWPGLDSLVGADGSRPWVPQDVSPR